MTNNFGKTMLAEIHEQPTAIQRLIDAEKARIWKLARPWRETPPRAIFIAARGTSDHAALYAKYLFETMNGIPVGLAAPSVASIYKAKVNVKDMLFIGISQSGEAADVAAVMAQAKRAGADTLAITNVGNSPLVSAAHHTITLHAKPEKAVAATKTFTSTMAALLLLSAALNKSARLLGDLERLPNLIENALQISEQARPKVERFRYLQECVVLGRGYNLSTAYELALKLRETSYLRAQPFASPDFVHGPIAMIGEGYPVIAIANQGRALASVLEVVAQVKSRGAEAVIIGNAPAALKIADVAFPVNVGLHVPEVISPFAGIVAGQIFTHALSLLKGFNPDQPRNLQKVTITM